MHIQDKVSLIGLKVESQLVLSEYEVLRKNINELVQDCKERGILYCIHLDNSNKETRTINLIIISNNDQIIERNNLSLNDALIVLNENFSSYSKSVVTNYEKIVKKSMKKKEKEHEEKRIKKCLKLLLNDQKIESKDLNYILNYLKIKKESIQT